MDAKSYYVLLSMVRGLGPRMLARLTEALGSPERVWGAPEQELRAVPDVSPEVVRNLVAKRKRLDPDTEMRRLRDEGIGVVAVDEPAYPALLRYIFDPPRVLYIKGDPAVLQQPMLAIVGARKATHYGLGVAEKIARDLAAAGLCIVSGMARGIDTAAHKGALIARRPTVAVLGCGVDIVYPPENKKVMADIIASGAVISEFPPGTAPVGGNFPQRNRVISGLSRGVMVIEAAEKSGSLITADFALEQGRDVFAVPGQVTSPLNTGAHRLIKQGAKLVEDARDVLEELGLAAAAEEPREMEITKSLTANEKKVYNIVSDNPVNPEKIIGETGMSSAEVLSTLLVLELKGLVRQLPGQRYIRCI